ncbi:uncharacterized protein prr14 [Hemibagrus wyckioides]|nr:uncharacterized protein prr14 [Hemibagrus wyckioides]XP_058260386.1 uncharacterized protein prr14 [Hemibagrus wyckioides]XP_058260394.1 uncharacterized protein prr14 [Hemibagrus wyckioides]
MVVDMLTSSQEQIPPCVTLMEEDGRNSPAALCPSRRSDRRLQAVPHAPVFHRSDDPGSSSMSRSPKTIRMNHSEGVVSSEQQRSNSSDRRNMESHEYREESRHRQTEDKPTRSCKRKLELMPLSSGSNDVTKAQDSEKKDLESPPPAKRWVIGPLFQTFKSKMASFTEIVMSPVRLFKPNEFPAGPNNESPSVTRENKEDIGNDGKEDAFPKKEKTKLSVVQTLNFDAHPSNVSDSEQNKVTISQSGSEHRRDSIPEDDGSYGLLNPASTGSTNQITPSGVQQCSSEENQNSINSHPLSRTGTDSVRTSLRKGSAKAALRERKPSDELTKNTEPEEKSKSRDQDQPLPKKLRLPTPAVGKRKKGREPERREREETVKSVGKKGTDGTSEQEEGSPEVTQIKTLENPTLIQTLKRREPCVSVERLSMCGSVVVHVSDLNSCNSSKGERMVLTRASRSRSKRENNVTCRSVALDATSVSTSCISPDLLSTIITNDSTSAGGPPSTGSVTCASSRTRRQRKHNKPSEERKPDPAGSCCSDLADCLRSSNGASEHSQQAHKNNIHRAKHNSETAKKTRVSKRRRVQRHVEAFEDQGMSMSLTLKVGSGLDGEKDTSSIMTCGIRTKGRKMGEDVIIADASCPSGTTPVEHFYVKDDHDAEKPEADQQRRWCVYSERRETQEDDPKAGPTSSGWNRLQRSLSCPDITSLQHGNDSPKAPVHDKTLCPPSPLRKGPHVNVNVPSPVKRTRRHTVCSVEIEREIAPLCLRKEVYPNWGSTSNHSYSHTPSKSLAALVSRFLSSPLAFLSKKSSRGHGDDSGYGASSSDLATVSSSSPSPPSLSSPAISRAPGGSAFYADTPHALQQSPLSSHSSVFDAVSMETDGVAQQEREEIERSSAVSEEKALSDSEIKTDNKQVERRKVSSIRIRKTLPKPQYNLTPMGLPKAVRIKKKVFSVEEIYTNKNFSKPPEGRLETIFEVPLSRRDGSQSLIGPKRVKRFVEFQEVGMTRKPRRPLVGGGGGGGGGAQRKAVGNPGMGRTRRGREEEVLHLQDFDSLLCSKLNELDVWMAREQMVY